MESRDPLRFDHGEQMPRRLGRQFGRLIGMTAAQVHRVMHGELAAVGAHKYHFAVLAALEEFGPASQAGLSDRTRIYKSDLVATINELERGGYVRREPDPDDRRRNVVTMTETGRERLAELDGVLAAAHDHVLASLGADDRERLMHLLRRINTHLAANPE